MKKALAFIFCIIFIFSLVGCKYLEAAPVASHTGQFVLPAGSSLPSATDAAPETVPTSAADSFTFRKTSWGMSADGVIASEGRQPDESTGLRIAYAKQTVLDRECTVFYNFSMNRLVSAGYDFAIKPSDLADSVSVYEQIVSGITEQYVSPSSSQTLWSNGQFKNDPQKYGLAVLLGDLVCATGWSISGSAVTCELHAASTGGVRSAAVTATWQAPAQPQPAANQTASPAQSASPSSTQSAAPTNTGFFTETPSTAPSGQGGAESATGLDIQLPPSTATPGQSGFSFRNTNWGMSKDAVITSEGKQPDRTTAGGVIYQGETYLDRDCSLFYSFDHGALLSGGYDIAESGSSRSIKNYNAAIASLAELYGDPAVSELLWSDAKRQGDPASYAQAVAEGSLVYRTVWYTANATVSCLLYGYGKGSQKKAAITVSFQNPAASTADIETPPGYSFRQTNWGMSMYQVITAEGRQPDDKGADYMIYRKAKYHNADCHIIYQFADSGLVSGSYMIYNMHTNPNSYIEDYNTAVSILRQSYGAPQASNQIWKPSSRYKNDPANYGVAVLRGDLSLSSQWTLPQAAIDCSITLANTIVAIDITFKDPAHITE